MYQVYILKLEYGKYFIGHTQSIDTLQEQLQKKNIKWINKYPYIKILKVINNCDKFDVDKHTKKYMEIYGIENVRGGSYYQFVLSNEIITQINNEINISEQSIYNNSSHSDEHTDNEIIEDSFDEIKDEFEIINKCSRCGSNDHYSYHCFVEFNLKNEILRCVKCREYGHIRKDCPITVQQKVLEKFQKLDNKIKKFIDKFM